MNTSATSTTRGARDHARAQAGATLDLPPGVVWDELVEGGNDAARIVPRGSVTRLVDVDGDACASVLVYNAARPHERLNVADTVKVQWQAYLGAGSLLLSDMGRALMTVIGDTSGRHDAFCGCSNERTNAAKYGAGGVHGRAPNARDRFAVALAKYGLERRDIAPNVNFFKGVRVGEHGEVVFDDAPAQPGAVVELRAELPVLIVVVNAPHVLDPRPDYVATPLRVTTTTGNPTTPSDPQWSATPEGERAYRNTETFLAERDAAAGR
jgi:urea carboxylase-associated protein 2